jgi:hypothetical protein
MNSKNVYNCLIPATAHLFRVPNAEKLGVLLDLAFVTDMHNIVVKKIGEYNLSCQGCRSACNIRNYRDWHEFGCYERYRF